MTLLRTLAYGSAISTFIMIILGGYVSATGSGDSCPDWPLCFGQAIPPLEGISAEEAEGILIEFTHRLFALVVGSFVLATMMLVWLRYRERRSILVLSTASFGLLIGQIVLGMVTVQSGLNPLVSTAHLAVASGFFALVLANALTIRNIPFEKSFRSMS